MLESFFEPTKPVRGSRRLIGTVVGENVEGSVLDKHLEGAHVVGKGVQGAQMANRALLQDAPNAIHHIV